MSKFKQSFIVMSRDNKRIVSFFSNLSNDFCEIRFLSLLNESALKNEVELDYSEVLIVNIKEEKKLEFLEPAYRFIESGVVELNGLTLFSGS